MAMKRWVYVKEMQAWCLWEARKGVLSISMLCEYMACEQQIMNAFCAIIIAEQRNQCGISPLVWQL